MGTLQGVMFVKGRSRQCGTNLHVLAHLPGDSVQRLNGVPFGMALPRPSGSRLTPQPAAARLELRVGSDRAAFAVVSAKSSPYMTRIHMKAVLRGFVAELWCDLWSWQDVIDLCGRITWSDRNSPSQWSGVDGDDVWIETATGVFWIDYAEKWGMATGGYRVQPHRDYYPDAMSFPFYGCWVPSVPTAAPQGDPLAALWDLRVESIQAARHGPIMALPDLSESWLATGGTIPLTVAAPVSRFDRAFLSQGGGILGLREYASPLYTGTSGNQAPFGIAKDYHLVNSGQDPRRLWQLRESTVDYLLRCHHHYDESGDRLRASDHPGWRTWSTATHDTSSDKLGKTGPVTDAFGRGFVDDQHRGDAYIACVRSLTDDPMLEADAQDRTETDVARAFRSNGWRDAPRAGGRLLQSWCQAYWTTDDDAHKAQLLTLLADEFELWESGINTPTGNLPRAQCGPVKTAEALPLDSRVLDGGPCWRPWQDTLLVVGLYHYLVLLQRAGSAGQADRCRTLLLDIARTSLRYGVVRAANGLLYPLTGVLWLPSGEANQESYYVFPRQGASFGDDAYDMQVGDRGWFSAMGWPTMVQAFLALAPEGEPLRAVANEIVSAPGSAGEAEWCIGSP